MRSLPDKGQKIKDMIDKLKDMISKREKADDLTAKFQKISISQRLKPKQSDTQPEMLDSDDDDDDDDDNDNGSIVASTMDCESKNTTATLPKAEVFNDLSHTENRDSSTSISNQHKKDNWSYDSAVTYAQKPKFEVK